MALTAARPAIGIYTLSADVALDAAQHCPPEICSLDRTPCLADVDSLGRVQTRGRGFVAASTHPGRSHGRGKETGPLARKADRRILRTNEPPYLRADQPPAHKVADHTEHGERVYPWCWRCLRPFLRMRRLLEHACWRGTVIVGEYPRRLRWRGGAVEASRIRFRLLVGDNLRLSLLLADLRRDGNRVSADFG